MELPQWLDENLLDSGPGAYETLDPRLRAEFKSQIALLYRFFGELEGQESRSRDWLGRELRAKSVPGDWALFVLDKHYASPSGLLAALIPAVLAGVEEILVCVLENRDEDRKVLNRAGEARCTGEDNGINSTGATSCADKADDSDLPLPLSAALELAGVEQIWGLAPAQLGCLFEYLRGQGDGAVVFLGDCFSAERFMLAALRSGLNCKCLPGAHDTALHLEPGNEAFWIWPDLAPDFFRRHTAGIFNL